jgi:hypothetical protein
MFASPRMHLFSGGCIAGGLRYPSSARRHKGSGGARRMVRPAVMSKADGVAVQVGRGEVE